MVEVTVKFETGDEHGNMFAIAPFDVTISPAITLPASFNTSNESDPNDYFYKLSPFKSHTSEVVSYSNSGGVPTFSSSMFSTDYLYYNPNSPNDLFRFRFTGTPNQVYSVSINFTSPYALVKPGPVFIPKGNVDITNTTYTMPSSNISGSIVVFGSCNTGYNTNVHPGMGIYTNDTYYHNPTSPHVNLAYLSTNMNGYYSGIIVPNASSTEIKPSYQGISGVRP